MWGEKMFLERGASFWLSIAGWPFLVNREIEEDLMGLTGLLLDKDRGCVVNEDCRRGGHQLE